MKVMRLAICAAAFAFAGHVALSEDYIDIGAMQAKLAAQEARLNDLQAKVYGNACEEDSGVVAEGLTSLRKNATVTIGGTVNTRYDYFKGKIDSRFALDDDGEIGAIAPRGQRRTISKTNYGDLNIADAKLEGKIDVSEYFDAYFMFDLQDGNRDDGNSPVSNAQNYWVRWKNICNSGFGVLVGRDAVRFGGIAPSSRFDTWGSGATADASGAYWDGDEAWFNGFGSGMAIAAGMPIRPTVSADSRTVQITPYWENKDGTFKFEASLFQAPEYYGANRSYQDDSGRWNRRRMNNGFGSVSAKLTWQPVEGLEMVGSIMNLHASHGGGYWDGYPSGTEWLEDAEGMRTSKNSFATYLGVSYRPTFFNKLNLYAVWTRGWNDAWLKDQDSNSFSFGFDFDILDNLTFYETFELVHARAGQAGNEAWNIHKANGWANEIGIKYTTSYGIWMDAGWRHESMTYKNRAGEKHTKGRGDAFFTTLGFDF